MEVLLKLPETVVPYVEYLPQGKLAVVLGELLKEGLKARMGDAEADRIKDVVTEAVRLALSDMAATSVLTAEEHSVYRESVDIPMSTDTKSTLEFGVEDEEEFGSLLELMK